MEKDIKENMEEKVKQKSCEEKIDEMLAETINDFEKALCADRMVSENRGGGFTEEFEYFEERDEKGFSIEGEYLFEDFTEWINSYALSYEDDPHFRAKKLVLSWGGGSDYFLFFEDGAIEYHFEDWFDGAKRELSGREYEVMNEVKEKLE